MEIELIDSFTALIEGASSSPLGIIALSIIVLSVVAIKFFQDAGNRMQMIVFSMLFIGIGFLAYSMLQVTNEPVNEALTNKSTTLQVEDNNQIIREEDVKNKIADKPQKQKTTQKQPKQGYVFLGTYRNEQWKDARFEVGDIKELSVGQELILKMDRIMFACPPYRKTIFSLKYTFCKEITGEVQERTKVKVIEEPKMIGFNRVWVKVEEVVK
jgi:16S rRNA G966 N2-methylase RsmD